MNIGIEYFPHLKNIERELNCLSHFQVSIPTLNKVSQFENLGLPLFLHSNLLNSFGENNWKNLELFRASIQKLNPVSIIEHGALTVQNGKKNGISSCDWREESVLDNINRWGDILGCEIVLENPPYQNISEIHRILEFSKKYDVEIACDIPHLIMTSISDGISICDFHKVLKDWNPLHRHIGGLKTSEDLLLDAHNIYNCWMLDLVQKTLGQGYTTLEQSEVWGKKAIKNNLNRVPQEYEPILEKLFNSNLHIMNEEEYNDYLALQRGKELGIRKVSRRIENAFGNDFIIYDYFTPFFGLFYSVMLEMEIADLSRISELFTRLYQHCSGIDSWIGRKNKYFLEYVSEDESLLLDLESEKEIVELFDRNVFFAKSLEGLSKISFGIYT